MPNRLIHENSPYLLEHAHNPVDWYPWGAEALQRAREEDKPIFLSIGYAACHWCHVMAHESFEDPETAALMNKHFINIKVDREERPDLDSVYMSAVVAMTGQGGWPMSVFLTPEGQPFFGGTYFPPERRYQRPSFREVLQAIARLWQEDRGRLLQSAQEITQHLQQGALPGSGRPTATLHPLDFGQVVMRLAQSYDWRFGGWGQAPKFPQPMAIEFLLLRLHQGGSMEGEMATHALEAMGRGGMYDVLGGGFARYSTDDRWLVPHFEKMLYDNAQLASAYLHGWLLSGREDFRRICENTLDFIVTELSVEVADGPLPQLAFCSSLDADSEGEEGKYYLWSQEEIHQALPPAQARLFCAAYGVTEAGNFEGRNVLQRAATPEELARQFDLTPSEVQRQLELSRQTLLQIRRQRVPPRRDDKALTAWNALALTAFAEAARYLQRPDYLAVAQGNATFLLEQLRTEAGLLRSWREGQSRYAGYLEDYAALVLALLALYQSDPQPRWFSAAQQLTAEMITHFYVAGEGFYDTRHDQQALILRPRDLQDNATPSGNALATLALQQMAVYQGREDWAALAEANLMQVQEWAEKYPLSFACWLRAFHLAANPPKELALLGPPRHPVYQEMLKVLWGQYRPDCLVAQAENATAAPEAPALLHHRPLLNEQPTAYVCRQFTCLQPTNSAQTLQSQLEST